MRIADRGPSSFLAFLDASYRLPLVCPRGALDSAEVEKILSKSLGVVAPNTLLNPAIISESLFTGAKIGAKSRLRLFCILADLILLISSL
jgi:hypothetical protein